MNTETLLRMLKEYGLVLDRANITKDKFGINRVDISAYIAKTPEPINELDTMNKHSLSTQALFVNAIRAKQYIVGSVDGYGNMSFNTNPAVHSSVAAARGECNRLAKATPGKMYLFVELTGAELVPTVNTLSI